MLQEIYKAAEQEAPNEMCGLLIEENGIEKFIKCKNLAEDKKSHFKIDPELLVRYQLTAKILYVVHSHYNEDSTLSKYDKNASKALGLPYMVVSYPEKGVTYYDPS